jgi:hypothetical protein
VARQPSGETAQFLLVNAEVRFERALHRWQNAAVFPIGFRHDMLLSEDNDL